MRVKRYVVDSMPDALQKIRMDLGKDAVILNTKQIKIGGFLGFFSKKRIEVIAATDSVGSAARAVKPKAVDQSDHAAPAANLSLVQHAESNAAAAVGTLELSPELPVQPENQALINEVRQMKELIVRFSNNSGITAVPEVLQPIEKKLIDQEIHPAIVENVIAQAMQSFTGQPDEWTLETAKSLVRDQLIEILKNESCKVLQHDTKIVHFVGPTGVGKTTTIAKLAAEQVLKFNRKVGFITADTYRIAAIEQLKTYANILNVPLEVVFSPQEMTKAFRTFADKDIIFMDTAGRNYRNELYVSELNALLKGNGQSETYLVLSLTSKYRDMKKIAENFSKFKLDKALFTKMDETETLGAIVNLAYDFGLRGSYITNGQNVPDDIEEMKEERIVDFIMGGIGHD